LNYTGVSEKGGGGVRTFLLKSSHVAKGHVFLPSLGVRRPSVCPSVVRTLGVPIQNCV